MLLLPVTLRLFCGFSYVFSSLHLVLRGREDVAHAVSRPSFVSEPWDSQKRAVLHSPSSIRFTQIIVAISSVFGRREQFSRRARRRKAGSGSASRVKVV